MNAQSILSYFTTWYQEPEKPKPAKDFPPEAFDYDDRIDPQVVAAIQKEANKKLDQQEWTVIERLGDGEQR
jgi:hypothetical protein